MPQTIEERRVADRERKKAKYAENPDKYREYCLGLYYKKKEKNPEFHSKPVGRPRKVVTDTVDA